MIVLFFKISFRTNLKMCCYKNLVPLLIVLVSIAIQSTTAAICAGCPMRQNPDHFDVKKLASALSTANSNEGIEKVISVSTQVVSGVRYTVVFKSTSGKICETSWVEMPWESKAPLGTKVSCKASLLEASDDVDGVKNLINAHMKQRRDAPETLSPDSKNLFEEHIGQILSDQANSNNVQVVTDMQVNTVERYGHGYKISAVVELASTNCTKDSRYRLEDCKLDSSQPRKHCSLTAIMVQPQGGRKWYKVSDVVCNA